MVYAAMNHCGDVGLYRITAGGVANIRHEDDMQTLAHLHTRVHMYIHGHMHNLVSIEFFVSRHLWVQTDINKYKYKHTCIRISIY